MSKKARVLSVDKKNKKATVAYLEGDYKIPDIDNMITIGYMGPAPAIGSTVVVSNPHQENAMLEDFTTGNDARKQRW